MNIFFISLPKSEDRRERLSKNLNEFNFIGTHIEGVDGRLLNNDEYKNLIADKLQIDPNKLTYEYFSNKSNFNCMERDINYIMSKVGCFLSHFLCLHQAVENNLSSLLILEDDSIIKKNLNFEYPYNSSVVYLGGTFYHKKVDPEYIKNRNSKFFKINSEYLTVYGGFGYFIPNREALLHLYSIYRRCFLDGKPKRKYCESGRLLAVVADRMLINYLQKEGNACVVNPQLITTDYEFPSTISDKPKYIKQQKNMSFTY